MVLQQTNECIQPSVVCEMSSSSGVVIFVVFYLSSKSSMNLFEPLEVWETKININRVLVYVTSRPRNRKRFTKRLCLIQLDVCIINTAIQVFKLKFQLFQMKMMFTLILTTFYRLFNSRSYRGMEVLI